MNISNILLYLGAGQSFLNPETWDCVKRITETYFIQKELYLCLGNETAPSRISQLMFKRLSYTVSDSDLDDFRIRTFNADVLILAKIRLRSVRAVRSRIIVLMEHTSDAESFHDYYGLLNVIYVLPIVNGCEIYAFDYSFDNLNLIDVWSEGSFSNNADLYARGVSGTNSSPFVVMSGPCPPYLYQASDGVSGPIEILLTTIAEHLNLTVQHKFPENFYIPTGKGTYFGYLEMLLKNEADFVQGCLGYTSESNLYAEHVPLPYEDSLAWCVPTPNPLPLHAGIATSFTPIVWGMVVFVFCVLSLVFYIGQQGIKPLGQCLLLTYKATLGQASSQLFQTSWLNGMFLLFVLYCQLLVWFYQSILLIHLSTVLFEEKIKSIEDAVDRGLVAYYFPTLKPAIEDSPYWDTMRLPNRSFPDLNTNLTLVTEEKNSIILGLRSYYEFTVREMYPKVALDTKALFFHLQGFPLASLMKRTHPLYEKVMRKTSHIFEAGLFNFWMKISDRSPRIEIYLSKRPLRIEHFQGAYFIFGVMILLSWVFFIAELAFGRRKPRSMKPRKVVKKLLSEKSSVSEGRVRVL